MDFKCAWIKDRAFPSTIQQQNRLLRTMKLTTPIDMAKGPNANLVANMAQ
jgi:hypothetical protein